ncbi:MAG: NAD-binding protein [Synechocystis sp.]|nr:NAD-binding protein [Synechocystis sp.]
MYDLAIIGASPEGLSAAQRGIQTAKQPRIALITQGWERAWAQKEPAEQNSESGTDPWECLRQLAALGVDVIPEEGTIQPTETACLWQGTQRTLTARAFLLTTDVDRYQATQHPWTSSNTAQPAASTNTWGIWGALPQNLLLAQQLAHRGHAVHLFSRNPHPLPGEDREMSDWLQRYLATQGVTFWGNCQGFSAEWIPDPQTHRLSFTTGGQFHQRQVDQFWQLPLPALPWQWLQQIPAFTPERESKASYLAVNDCLQTTHPQIFACGGWLKGYTSPLIAIQEGHYVVDRVFGDRQGPIDYAPIPFGLDLPLPWYRIGLNEQQATEQGEQIHIYHGYEAYQPDSPLRGFCKILTDQQDHILGAHWFGHSAKAGISLLTLAWEEGIPLRTLKKMPVVVEGMAQVWQTLKPSPTVGQ